MGKEIYILLADQDGTLRSVPEPFGVAVTNEEEADKFVKEAKLGYSRSYQKVKTFHNFKAALEYNKKEMEERYERFRKSHEKCQSVCLGCNMPLVDCDCEGYF